MDKITIKRLEIYAGHGVFPEENQMGQTFYVNAILYGDIRQAGQKDDLTLSTHYGEVSHLINHFLKEHRFQLIESVAEQTAQAVLLAFPILQAVEIEIEKPQAPIGLPFESVSVSIHRGWKKSYLGIGSNMGNKEDYIETAIEQMRKQPLIRRIKCSSLLKTKPYGGVEQEDFLNGAIEIETLMNPKELLYFLQEIERKAGRERKIHWGPRTLDLDILFYEGCIAEETELMIPHPDLHNRFFVLEPLCQLRPYLMHPLLGKSVKQLLLELPK